MCVWMYVCVYVVFVCVYINIVLPGQREANVNIQVFLLPPTLESRGYNNLSEVYGSTLCLVLKSFM